MKRIGIFAVAMLLAFPLAGCDSGIPEGAPKEGATNPQPDSFKEFMKQNAANMQPKRPTAKQKAAAEAAPKTDAPAETKKVGQ
jgi:hypothetical protein